MYEKPDKGIDKELQPTATGSEGLAQGLEVSGSPEPATTPDIAKPTGMLGPKDEMAYYNSLDDDNIGGLVETPAPQPTTTKTLRDRFPGYSDSTYKDLGNLYSDDDEDEEGIKETADMLESLIERKPKEAKEVVEEIENKDPTVNEIPDDLEREIDQVTDGNPNNSEVRDDVVEEEVKQDPEEAKEIIDKLSDYEGTDESIEDFYNKLESGQDVYSILKGETKPEEKPKPGDSFIDTTKDVTNIDDFISDLEKKENEENPGRSFANKVEAAIANHPMRNVLENKFLNMFMDFSRGKQGKFHNAEAKVGEGWKKALETAFKYNPKIQEYIKNPDALIKRSVGLDLSNPELREYAEKTFGHDFVKTQDRQKLNKDLRNRNLAIAKMADKYMDRNAVRNPETGKYYTPYQVIGKIARGELDADQLYKSKPSITPTGRKVSSQILARRSKARDALGELKLNNEIKAYLSGAFDKFIDVSELRGKTGLDLLDALKAQISGNVPDEMLDAAVKENNWLEEIEERQDPLVKLEQETKESSGIDWDTVKVYKPGEDPYYKVDEDYDPRIEENLNYEYPEGVGDEGVRIHKDEDFAGPDELPAVVPYSVDEDKQLATINDGVPEEIYYEPSYDTSMYNFETSWEDITPEKIDEEVEEDDSIDEDKKEEVKERRKKLVDFIKANHHVDSLRGSNLSSTRVPGSSFGGAFKSSGGHLPSYNVSGGLSSIGRANTNRPKPSVGTKINPANLQKTTPSKAQVSGAKMSAAGAGYRTSNGTTFGSGSVDKTGNSLIKVSKHQLPNGFANNQADLYSGDGVTGKTNNLRDSYLSQLERRIKSLDKETAEHFGFSYKCKHVEYKDIPLEECSGGDLKEIEDILTEIGV